MEHDICRHDELTDGAMRAIEAGSQKILLARVEGCYHAVGAVCPHAGAPLVEGVLSGGVVTCPWHKAAFCVGTGKRTEPPAVDDLPRFAVGIVDGRVMVTV